MILKEYKSICDRIKAKERDVEQALDAERMQLLFELNRHDYQTAAPVVIIKDVIRKDKTEIKEIPRTIEILYEASKIPSVDFYPVLEDSSVESSD